MTLTFLKYVYDSHCHSSDAFNVYTFNTSLCAFTTFVFLEDGEKGRYNVIFKMTCHTTRLKKHNSDKGFPRN